MISFFGSALASLLRRQPRTPRRFQRLRVFNPVIIGTAVLWAATVQEQPTAQENSRIYQVSYKGE